jgi:hypothetical protein
MFRNWSKPRSVPVTLRLPFSFTAERSRRGSVRSGGNSFCVPLHAATEHTRHAPFIFLSMYLRTGGRRGHSVERTASATAAKGFTSGPWSRATCGAARAASKRTAPRGLRCGRRGCRACTGTAGLAGEWVLEGRRTSSAQALGRPWRRHAHSWCASVTVFAGAA